MAERSMLSLLTLALAALLTSAQKGDLLRDQLPPRSQQLYSRQSRPHKDGERPYLGQLLGRYSGRDPDRFDFFGEHRQEQCQDDMDCRHLITGQECDRKENDAAGYCRCPDKKPVKLVDNGRIKCVPAKVEEPRCTSTTQCTATNPHLQCVDQKCACVSPNVLHHVKGCIPGENTSTKTASWMAPLGFLFTILAIMTCTFFVTRYRREDDGLEDQILSDSLQSSAQDSHALEQQRPRRSKSNYARFHQWFDNLVQPKKSLRQPERRPPTEASPTSASAPGGPGALEGDLEAGYQSNLMKESELPGLRTSHGAPRISEELDHRRIFLPLPFNMKQVSLRNVARTAYKESRSKPSHGKTADAGSLDITTGQRYRATIRSPHSKDEEQSEAEPVLSPVENKKPVLETLDSQDKISVPLPVVDSTHQESSSSSNDIKLPPFSRMSKHYESEDAAALKIRPGDVRAVPVHVKRLRRGLELLRSERQQKAGNLQRLLDGRDLYEREDMFPLDSSSSESPLSTRPNSVSRDIQTDITVPAAIPVLPFASLNAVSPLPAMMKSPPTTQLGSTRRGLDIPMSLFPRESSTDAGDARELPDNDAADIKDFKESIPKRRFINTHEWLKQPVIFEEEDILPEAVIPPSWAARQQTPLQNNLSTEFLQVLQVDVENCSPGILGAYDKRNLSSPDGTGMAQEKTPSIGGEGGSGTFLNSRLAATADGMFSPDSTLKTRSCYSVNKEAVLHEAFSDVQLLSNAYYAMELGTSPIATFPQVPEAVSHIDEFSYGSGYMPELLLSQNGQAEFASRTTLSHQEKGLSAGEASYKSFEVDSQPEEIKGANDVKHVN